MANAIQGQMTVPAWQCVCLAMLSASCPCQKTAESISTEPNIENLRKDGRLPGEIFPAGFFSDDPEPLPVAPAPSKLAPAILILGAAFVGMWLLRAA